MTKRITAAGVRMKRAYERPARDDGTRILVDRLWPRGLSKEAAAIDEWLKGIAPSTALRQWFGHKPERWEEFRERYRAELSKNEAVVQLRQLSKKEKHVTLLYAAHDVEHNQAVVLAELLEGRKRSTG